MTQLICLLLLLSNLGVRICWYEPESLVSQVCSEQWNIHITQLRVLSCFQRAAQIDWHTGTPEFQPLLFLGGGGVLLLLFIII